MAQESRLGQPKNAKPWGDSVSEPYILRLIHMVPLDILIGEYQAKYKPYRYFLAKVEDVDVHL